MILSIKKIAKLYHKIWRFSRVLGANLVKFYKFLQKGKFQAETRLKFG